MGPLSSQPVSSQISIHAPHARSDSAISRKKALSLLFQSTLLMRGATISRHRSRSCRRHFNPRSSCEERLAALDCVQCIAVFQSTLLMRGATLCSAQRPLGYCDFNPRSSCEERRQLYKRIHIGAHISIHAPHARSDETTGKNREKLLISIHAPHARSDDDGIAAVCIATYFNPRSSCEERHVYLAIVFSPYIFQSTLLMRGATAVVRSLLTIERISIHAPHARSDLWPRARTRISKMNFNPRSSCEERRGHSS